MIGWVNCRKLNGDHFRMKKSKKGGKDLDYYLDEIDLDNYWIYKSTKFFRRVEAEDIGKYASYIFFRKDIYYKEDIDLWIGYIINIKNDLNFLDRPFPRIEILEKIEVV